MVDNATMRNVAPIRSSNPYTGEVYVYNFVPPDARAFADGIEYGDTKEWPRAAP